MRSRSIGVLLVEDDADYAWLVQEVLAEATAARFHQECAGRLSEGLARLAADAPDVVLLDLSLPDSRGLETFLALHGEAPEVPILVLTGICDQDTAVKVLRAGAQDYLVKGQVNGELLARALQHANEGPAGCTPPERPRRVETRDGHAPASTDPGGPAGRRRAAALRAAPRRLRAHLPPRPDGTGLPRLP